MIKRKQIIINGTKWWYADTSYSRGEFGEWNKTQTSFYDQPTTEKVSKLFVFFGPTETEYINDTPPKFSVDIDIEDPKYSKEAVKELIDAQLTILKRKQEIARGEII